ncbi:MAG: hypothetical protein QM519_07730 [Bacteroidia bacterium]|jgi:hypothetical protein|nr:hypothetical protein [Bacteroidia bacterium]
MLDKDHLIDEITSLNPSAGRDWLELFDTDDLRRYLDHLHHACTPRGADSVWHREGDTPPVVMRIAA